MAGLHPEGTAWRAVDACGGAYTPKEEASGYADGHRAALDAAMGAVKKPDALMGELLEALQWLLAEWDALGYGDDLGQPIPDRSPVANKARAAIAKALGQ